MCRRLGGVRVAAELFRNLAPRYDPVQERYHHVRRPSAIGEQRSSLLGAGYLLQLAAKTAGSPVSWGPETEGLVDQLFHLTSDIVAVHDVEPYDPWANVFQNRATLFPYLQDIALFDHAVALRQLRPSDLGAFVRGVFDWVDDDDAREHLGWTVDEAVRIVDPLFSAASRLRRPFAFSERDAVRLSGLPAETVRAVLQTTTHPGPVNEDYLMPAHGDQATFGFRPFLRLPGGNRVLAQRPMLRLCRLRGGRHRLARGARGGGAL